MLIQENLSIEEKLSILSDAAKYDAACTSSGLDRAGRAGRLGGLLSEKVERGGDSIRFRKENGGDGFVSARRSGRNLSDVSLYGLSIIYYIIGVKRFSV